MFLYYSQLQLYAGDGDNLIVLLTTTSNIITFKTPFRACPQESYDGNFRHRFLYS